MSMHSRTATVTAEDRRKADWLLAQALAVWALAIVFVYFGHIAAYWAVMGVMWTLVCGARIKLRSPLVAASHAAVAIVVFACAFAA